MLDMIMRCMVPIIAAFFTVIAIATGWFWILLITIPTLAIAFYDWFQSSWTITAVAPQRSTFSFMRPPNTPFWQTTTVSPGCTRFTKQVSMPAEPGAETGMVSSLLVWNA